MKVKKYYLTPAGLKKYKEEYDRLKKKKREERSKMKESRDELWRPEDLNPDYEALRGDLSFIERRLKDLEHIFKNVRLIRRPHRDSKKIIVGSKITIEIAGERESLNLVGTLEANPSEGKISVDSPVGKSLLNHEEGDEVIIEFPIKRVYKILKVEFP